MSSWAMKLRRSCSRPANAVLKVVVMSWSLADPTAVEQQRQRAKRLFGGGVAARRGQRNQRAVVQPAARGYRLRAGQLDVQACRAGWSDRRWRSRSPAGRRRRRASHRDQRVPALPLDSGDVTDGDVADPDPLIPFDIGDVGHLRLDFITIRVRCPRCRAAAASWRPPSPAHPDRTSPRSPVAALRA